jgi:predicted ATPase
MRDLAAFRDAVRRHRRAAGRTQQQLARTIGLHPDVLSHKLNAGDHAVLTAADVTGIVTALARWAALQTRSEAEALLELMDVPAHAIPAAVWAAPPLAGLVADALIAHAPTDAAPSTPVAGWRIAAGVPVPRTPLIGRIAEREAIRAALDASRLVTLTGVGGTGKTRLAVQVAAELTDRYPDGVAFADLAAVRQPELLALALARTLGLDPPSAEVAEAHLIDALQGRQVLLVCDNLEQLLDATPLLGRLLAAAPGLQILATSRIPLRLYGEQVLRVPPLGLPTDADPTGGEAIQLFLRRARAARADFTADGEDLTAVAAICAALDGLPLAIELAAAMVRLYPPPALLDRLGDRLGALAGGPRDLPHRQRTLRAALEWSHALLDVDAQRLFAGLGVFAGPFDAAAAAAVAGTNGEAGPMLARLDVLAEQSLLEVLPSPTPQFRLLETVREYALARLSEAGEPDAARRRHLEHYLAVAHTAGAALSGPQDRVALDTLEAAYPNIRAAFDFVYSHDGQDRGRLDAGLRLAIALVPLWHRRLSIAEGAWQFERLRTLDAERGAAEPSTRAHALLEQSMLECFRADYPRSIALAEQGRVLCRQLDDHRGLGRAYRILGEAAIATGDDDAAESHFRAGLAEATRTGDRGAQAAAYNMLGQVARHHARYTEATTLLRHALRLWTANHDPYGVACVMNSLGEVARDAGHADQARRRFTAALQRDRHLGNARGMAYDLEGLAAAAALDGDGRQALVYVGAAQTLREHNSGPLPPVEQAILTRILAPALDRLTPQEREQALTQGRNQPLDDTISEARRASRQPEIANEPGTAV